MLQMGAHDQCAPDLTLRNDLVIVAVGAPGWGLLQERAQPVEVQHEFRSGGHLVGRDIRKDREV